MLKIKPSGYSSTSQGYLLAALLGEHGPMITTYRRGLVVRTPSVLHNQRHKQVNGIRTLAFPEDPCFHFPTLGANFISKSLSPIHAVYSPEWGKILGDCTASFPNRQLLYLNVDSYCLQWIIRPVGNNDSTVLHFSDIKTRVAGFVLVCTVQVYLAQLPSCPVTRKALVDQVLGKYFRFSSWPQFIEDGARLGSSYVDSLQSGIWDPLAGYQFS